MHLRSLALLAPAAVVLAWGCSTSSNGATGEDADTTCYPDDCGATKPEAGPGWCPADKIVVFYCVRQSATHCGWAPQCFTLDAGTVETSDALSDATDASD